MGILVLSRKKDESVFAVVNGQVIARVLLVDIHGDKSRIGFEADPAIKFYRNEVWERMQEEAKNVGTTGIQLHGDSPRVVAGETEESGRPTTESPI